MIYIARYNAGLNSRKQTTKDGIMNINQLPYGTLVYCKAEDVYAIVDQCNGEDFYALVDENGYTQNQLDNAAIVHDMMEQKPVN